MTSFVILTMKLIRVDELNNIFALQVIQTCTKNVKSESTKVNSAQAGCIKADIVLWQGFQTSFEVQNMRFTIKQDFRISFAWPMRHFSDCYHEITSAAQRCDCKGVITDYNESIRQSKSRSRHLHSLFCLVGGHEKLKSGIRSQISNRTSGLSSTRRITSLLYAHLNIWALLRQFLRNPCSQVVSQSCT